MEICSFPSPKAQKPSNTYCTLLYPVLLILNLTPSAFSTSLISGGGGLARKTGRSTASWLEATKLSSLAANQSCFQLHASFVYDPLGMPECGAILAVENFCACLLASMI